jgi:AmmeMemoRadiSam system protein B
MRKTAFLPLLLILMLSCSRKEANPNPPETPLYHTWLSMNEMEYGEPVSPVPLEIPPHGFFPWAGIASHHLLAHEYLDAWFSRLAEMRKPRRFYILSPDHYGISTEHYALTTGSWESGFGKVETDINKVKELAELLEVDLDTRVFRNEHGVSTLMPYIKKYFPTARVVVIAYESEGPVNIPFCLRLAQALESEFDEKGKKENFLLISTDFSHHADLKKTAERDFNSEQYLRNTGNASWYMAFCDNRPGMYVIDRLGKNNLQSVILYHTNSWEISNQWDDDVTSYFFVYFSDKIEN